MNITNIKKLIMSSKWKDRAEGYAQLDGHTQKVQRKLMNIGVNDKHRLVRANVACYMGQTKDSYYVPLLLELLKDKSNIVQMYAAEALGYFKNSKRFIEEPLIGLLKHPKSFVRTFAAESLGDIQSQKAILPLKKLIKADQNKIVKAVAIDSLGYIGNKKISPWILSLLKKSDDEMSATIYAALIELGSNEYYEPLINLLNRKNYRVRIVAINKLYSVVSDHIKKEKILKVLVEHQKTEKSKKCLQALDKAIRFLRC